MRFTAGMRFANGTRSLRMPALGMSADGPATFGVAIFSWASGGWAAFRRGAFGAGRTQLGAADLAIAVLIELGDGLARLGDFVCAEFAVVIQVQRLKQRVRRWWGRGVIFLSRAQDAAGDKNQWQGDGGVCFRFHDQ